MHAFTHMDTPQHFDPQGFTTDSVTPDMTMGDAAVVDISDIEPNTTIDAARLEHTGGHVQEGDIVLLRAGWDQRRSLDTPAFWTETPLS